MNDSPRILVEGGPVHRRVNHILAALVGFVIGASLGFGFLIVSNGQLAHRNCHNNSRLAKIERRFIERQEAQTAALLSRGITFGISPSELPKLVKANAASEAFFLSELDSLARENCR